MNLKTDSELKIMQEGGRISAMALARVLELVREIRIPGGEVIYDRVWGYDFGGESNIIEVYVRYLRQKTEAEDELRLLHTVRGAGYRFSEEG